MGREMVWLSQERFQGGVALCAHGYSPSTPLVGRSIEEMKRRYDMERDKEFRAHVCAGYPRAKTRSTKRTVPSGAKARIRMNISTLNRFCVSRGAIGAVFAAAIPPTKRVQAKRPNR
jgi:hypothetical protein